MTRSGREAARVERAAQAARGEIPASPGPSWAGRPTTSYVDVACRLKVALETLPDHADGIARMLETHRVRGYMCGAHACPLSNYLTIFVGHEVIVGHEQVQADEGRWWNVAVATPPAVGSFISGFDAGEYPSLVHPEN